MDMYCTIHCVSWLCASLLLLVVLLYLSVLLLFFSKLFWMFGLGFFLPFCLVIFISLWVVVDDVEFLWLLRCTERERERERES
jgi:hypothetical protein